MKDLLAPEQGEEVQEAEDDVIASWDPMVNKLSVIQFAG